MRLQPLRSARHPLRRPREAGPGPSGGASRWPAWLSSALARVPGCPLSQHPFLLPTLILKLPRGDDAFGFLLFYWFTCLVKLQG